MSKRIRPLLGIAGFLCLLAFICLVFAFVVPLESDSTSGAYDLCDGSNLMPDEQVDIPENKSFHVVKGELGAYTQAKQRIDAHQARCTTVKLFL